jgi:hypothetical protein
MLVEQKSGDSDGSRGSAADEKRENSEAEDGAKDGMKDWIKSNEAANMSKEGAKATAASKATTESVTDVSPHVPPPTRMPTFVFTSSIAAYGDPEKFQGRSREEKQDLQLHESDPQFPEDPYGIAKHAVELDLTSAHEMFGLQYIIFRPHNVYGPRQNIADKFRNAVGIFLNQIMRGEEITIFGDGEQTRAFSYISDVG